MTLEAQRAADVVVLLGNEAQLEEVEGTRYERWDTDEPNTRGIEGKERMRMVRMRMVRDDGRVRVLLQRLLP